MTQIYDNIPADTKEAAELAFTLAIKLDEIHASNLLNSFTNYYCSIHTNPEIRDFLQFYFNLRMEQMKNE